MRIEGFRIRAVPWQTGMDLISEMEGIGSEAAYERAEIDLCCVDLEEKQFVAVMKSYDSSMTKLPGETEAPKQTLVEDMLIDSYRLHKILGLARLYDEGDIRAPLVYGFEPGNGKPRRIIKSMTVRTLVSRVPFRVGEDKIHEFNLFLKSAKDPSENGFVKRSFRCFEDSFATRAPGLAFTSIAMGLEYMFHRRIVQKISEEVAKNCATLIATNQNEFRVIETKLRMLYRKRSGLLHEAGTIGEEDILVLRSYLRRSIRKALELGLDAEQVKRYRPT